MEIVKRPEKTLRLRVSIGSGTTEADESFTVYQSGGFLEFQFGDLDDSYLVSIESIARDVIEYRELSLK